MFFKSDERVFFFYLWFWVVLRVRAVFFACRTVINCGDIIYVSLFGIYIFNELDLRILMWVNFRNIMLEDKSNL